MIDYGYSFTYSDYKSIKKDKIKKIETPNFFNYENFIKNTSIATSTMMVEKKILNNISFQKIRLCEDYYLKCQILKENNSIKFLDSIKYYCTQIKNNLSDLLEELKQNTEKDYYKKIYDFNILRFMDYFTLLTDIIVLYDTNKKQTPNINDYEIFSNIYIEIDRKMQDKSYNLYTFEPQNDLSEHLKFLIDISTFNDFNSSLLYIVSIPTKHFGNVFLPKNSIAQIANFTLPLER